MSESRYSLDVLCLGLANHDLLVAVEGYPPADAKMEALDLEEQGGGPAASASVAIARLGGKVALLSTVGDDERGERILADLAKEGVDVSRCTRAPGTTSSLSVIVVDRKAGTRNVFHYLGTMPFRVEQVDPEMVRSARVLLVDSQMPRSALEVAGIARKAGVPVVVDPGEPKPGVEELMAAADYLIPPVNMALWVTGEEDPERAAVALLGRGARAVVVTLGAAGYLVATAEGVRRESAFPVEVVDTTGAGDAFHGGFAFAVARGRPLLEAARFAAAVAALKCRKPGGRAGLPALSEVEELLSRG